MINLLVAIFYSFLAFLVICAVYTITWIIVQQKKYKPMFDLDKQPGKTYKAYINLNNGKVRYLPERVSEEYAKDCWGLVRFPTLDYTVES